MNIEKNKAIYRRFIQEVFNAGRLDLLPELLSPAYVYRDAPPGTPPGPEAIRQVVTMFRAALPDLEITIEEQIAERDLVCSRATTRGTHRGHLFGVPASGRKIEMAGLTIVRIVGDRLVESWVRNDVMSLMNQIAAGPAK
jgi:steroid delta-isomerase-like uncharacterized protein